MDVETLERETRAASTTSAKRARASLTVISLIPPTITAATAETYISAQASRQRRLFGLPLREKPFEEKSNKVLWIAKNGQGGPLLEALRNGDGAPTHREIPGGPGPSIVDLPTGYWRLDLSWPGGEERIYPRYLEPAP
jgi:hypothetical protein